MDQMLDLMAKTCDERRYPHFRLDGSTATAARMGLVDRFNDPQGSERTLTSANLQRGNFDTSQLTFWRVALFAFGIRYFLAEFKSGRSWTEPDRRVAAHFVRHRLESS